MAVKKMSISEIENLRKDSNNKIKTGDKMTQEQIDFYRAEAKKKTIPLEVDGKNFGMVSQNAYRAISNGLLGYYAPVDIEEKRVLNEYKEYIGYNESKKETEIGQTLTILNENSTMLQYSLILCIILFCTVLVVWIKRITGHRKSTENIRCSQYAECKYCGNIVIVGDKHCSCCGRRVKFIN